MQRLHRGSPCAAGRGFASGAFAAPQKSFNAAVSTTRRARAATPVTSVIAQQQDADDSAVAPSTSGSDAGAAAGPGLAAAQQQQQQQQLGGRVARFRATKQAVQVVQELQSRSLAEYMALPASQYSVLDARKIERVDESTFRCYVGQLSFLGFSVEPVITVSVSVEPRGCTIRLLSCRLQGSRLVEEVNNKFSAQMTNAVVWEPTEDPGAKQISSSTTLSVDVEVPGWLVLPTSAVEAAGSGVMAATLNAMVPSFLRQLERDYALWASGDTSRRPLGEGIL